MANSAAETLVGAAVVAVAVGFLAFASQSTSMGTTSDSYELNASFNSAEGISVGTDVRLAGVKVGTVTGLELDRETYQARLSFAVAKDVLIPDDSEISVASEGLLGGSFIEVAPGGSDFMLEDGEEVLLTQSSVSLLNLLLKFATGDGSG